MTIRLSYNVIQQRAYQNDPCLNGCHNFQCKLTNTFRQYLTSYQNHVQKNKTKQNKTKQKQKKPDN